MNIGFKKKRLPEDVAMKSSKYTEAGFNLGFNGKGDSLIKDLVQHLEQQKETLINTKQHGLERTEKLLRDARNELTSLREKRLNHPTAVYSFRPESLLMSITAYCIGWWVAHTVFAQNSILNFHLLFSLLIFNGVWAIFAFFLSYNYFFVEWTLKKTIFHRIVFSVVIALMIGFYVFDYSKYLSFILLPCSLFLAALSITQYMGSALLRSLERKIEKKERQIIAFEDLIRDINESMWNLINQIETGKTEAVLQFHKGYIYGLSLNQSK